MPPSMISSLLLWFEGISVVAMFLPPATASPTQAPNRCTVEMRFDAAGGEGLDPEPAGGVGGGGGGLAWLLHPVTAQRFLSHHWQSAPVHVSRPHHRDYLNQLQAGLADVETLLALQAAVNQDPTLMHPSGTHSQANCEWAKNGMTDRKDNYGDVFEAYLDGATVVCHLVAAYWPSLADLMLRLKADTGFSYMANLYLTPRGSQGFTPHNDNKDGLLLQTAGSKQWLLRETTFPNPLRDQRVGRPWQPAATTHAGPVIFEGSVEEGDVLHIPRGVVHSAAATDNSPSMHFTVSPVNAHWAEWIECLLGEEDALVSAAAVDALPGGRPAASASLNAARKAVLDTAAVPANGWLRSFLPLNYTRMPSEVLARVALPLLWRLWQQQLGNTSAEASSELAVFAALFLEKLEHRDQLAESLTSPSGAEEADSNSAPGWSVPSAKLKIAQDYTKRLAEAARGLHAAALARVQSQLIHPAATWFVVARDFAFEVDDLLESELEVTWGELAAAAADGDGDNDDEMGADSAGTDFERKFGGGETFFRRTAALEETLAWLVGVAGSPSRKFRLADMPGNDPFEKVCLARRLLAVGAAEQLPR